jgi:L-amino acid N-acyltransferase
MVGRETGADSPVATTLDVVVRDAAPDDLPAILAIYNDAVLTGTAIWNDTVSDLAGRRSWFEERRAAGFPVLVATVGGEVAGYAGYGPFRPHQGFRHTAELSIYVADGRRGGGVGGRLMAALVERARSARLHVLVGGIEAGNAGSLRLHARHGFVETGRLPQVGAKFGRWLDLVFMQLTLDSGPPPG